MSPSPQGQEPPVKKRRSEEEGGKEKRKQTIRHRVFYYPSSSPGEDSTDDVGEGTDMTITPAQDEAEVLELGQLITDYLNVCRKCSCGIFHNSVEKTLDCLHEVELTKCFCCFEIIKADEVSQAQHFLAAKGHLVEGSLTFTKCPFCKELQPYGKGLEEHVLMHHSEPELMNAVLNGNFSTFFPIQLEDEEEEEGKKARGGGCGIIAPPPVEQNGSEEDCINVTYYDEAEEQHDVNLNSAAVEPNERASPTGFVTSALGEDAVTNSQAEGGPTDLQSISTSTIYGEDTASLMYDVDDASKLAYPPWSNVEVDSSDCQQQTYESKETVGRVPPQFHEETPTGAGKNDANTLDFSGYDANPIATHKSSHSSVTNSGHFTGGTVYSPSYYFCPSQPPTMYYPRMNRAMAYNLRTPPIPPPPSPLFHPSTYNHNPSASLSASALMRGRTAFACGLESQFQYYQTQPPLTNRGFHHNYQATPPKQKHSLPQPTSFGSDGMESNFEPIVKCPKCEKTYSTLNHNYVQFLERHMNTHLNIWPFFCCYCVKGYLNKHSYKEHMKQKHGEEHQPGQTNERR